MLKKLKLNGSMKTTRPPRTDTQKRCPFHYRGLECQSRSQEIPGVTGKFDLRVQNGAGQKANREPQSQKTKQTSHGPQPCLTLWNYEPCRVGPPKMDGSWWRVLLKRGPLEKGMADCFSILALRTPWTVWKGKKIRHWKIHMDIIRWSIPKSDWLYSLQPKMEKLYSVSKNKTGSRLWLRSWTPYCQIQTEIEESKENL